MINILVIGSGAREAAIVYKLKKDGRNKIKIICIGTNQNPAIDNLCRLYTFKKITYEDIKTFIGFNKINFAIIGPENPLKEGIADLLEENGIPCMGPLRQYAQIETSKIFARQFLDKHGLNEYSPKYLVYDGNNFDDIKKLSDKLVVKFDGLHGGKGVKVQDIDFDHIDDLIPEIEESKEAIICEEKLEGEEFSLMAITDGIGNIRHFPPIQDYKRLKDNDLGPNTGSMGSVSFKNHCLPFLEKHDILKAQYINKQIVRSLKKENGDNLGFKGIIYGSYIKTKDGIKVIEYNARLGYENSLTIPYKEDFQRGANQDKIFYGASLKALYNLGIKKGYSLIGTNMNGNNAFFVKNKLIVGTKLTSKKPSECFNFNSCAPNRSV